MALLSLLLLVTVLDSAVKVIGNVLQQVALESSNVKPHSCHITNLRH